jgi:ParB family chromosome partitioning protein
MSWTGRPALRSRHGSGTLMALMGKVVLGKGLGALINTPKPAATAAAAEPGHRVEQIALAEVVPSPLQPRKSFEPQHLEELMESIREHGIIQPLIVRRVAGKCELIAGERRWRAASQLGLSDVPVIVRHASDRDVLEMALIENLQREDLNPIEEAVAYKRLAAEFALRQEDIAARVGKSRSVIANSLRLLDLHPQVQSYLVRGRLSVGHAKVLLGLDNPAEQEIVAEMVVRQGCTVRATEKLVAQYLSQQGPAKVGRPGSRPALSGATIDRAVQHLQDQLRERLATHVAIHHAEKRGRIEIEYYGNDDLERIIKLLGVLPE